RMLDSLVVHLDLPSPSPTVTKFPIPISGWILIPERVSFSQIENDLSLSIVFESGEKLLGSQFSQVTIGGRCLTQDPLEPLYLSRPLKIDNVGRRIAADGFESHLCFDFSGEISSAGSEI